MSSSIKIIALCLYLTITILGLIISIFYIWPESLNMDPLGTNMHNFEKSNIPDNYEDTINIEITDSTKINTSNSSINNLKTNISYPDTNSVSKIYFNFVIKNKVMFLVLLIGALGACLHAITSLTEYIGNNSFNENWYLWYILRPLVGGILSLLFYFIIRGGFVSQIENTSNFYGIIALAALTGLFSKQALYKLSEVFDVLFKNNKEKDLKNKIHE